MCCATTRRAARAAAPSLPTPPATSRNRSLILSVHVPQRLQLLCAAVEQNEAGLMTCCCYACAPCWHLKGYGHCAGQWSVYGRISLTPDRCPACGTGHHCVERTPGWRRQEPGRQVCRPGPHLTVPRRHNTGFWAAASAIMAAWMRRHQAATAAVQHAVQFCDTIHAASQSTSEILRSPLASGPGRSRRVCVEVNSAAAAAAGMRLAPAVSWQRIHPRPRNGLCTSVAARLAEVG